MKCSLSTETWAQERHHETVRGLGIFRPGAEHGGCWGLCEAGRVAPSTIHWKGMAAITAPLVLFWGGIPDWNYDNYGGFIGTLEYELTINGFIGTFYWDIYKWLRYIGTLEYDYIKTINGFSGHWAWTNILFLFIKVWVSKSDPTVGWSCGPVLQQNKFDLPETTVSTGAKMKGSDWLTYWSWQCYNNPERDNEVHGIAITLLWQICVHFCACEY